LSITRVNAGIPGLEKLIFEGIPEGSPVLVSGSPGTGKTLLGLQFLNHGIMNNEPGVYVTFEEPKESILTASDNFGWKLRDNIATRKFDVMEYFELGNEAYITEIDRLKRSLRDLEDKKRDLRNRGDFADELELRMADYQNRIRQVEETITHRRYSITQHEREEEFLERLYYIVTSMQAKRLVIDSLSAYAIYDESRESMHRFIRRVRDLKTTTILTSELPRNTHWLSHDGVSEFVCDGIIVLSSEYLKDRNYRKIRVEKMRHTKINRTEKYLWFTDAGLDVKETPQEF